MARQSISDPGGQWLDAHSVIFCWCCQNINVPRVNLLVKPPLMEYLLENKVNPEDTGLETGVPEPASLINPGFSCIWSDAFLYKNNNAEKKSNLLKPAAFNSHSNFLQLSLTGGALAPSSSPCRADSPQGPVVEDKGSFRGNSGSNFGLSICQPGRPASWRFRKQSAPPPWG
jgi:hypothetical protein